MKLIFIHGSGGWGGIWHKQLAHFKSSKAITLPGHPDGVLCHSVDEYTDWLHGVIEYITDKEIILVGHSLGGAIAMTYALKYTSNLQAVILAATGARLRVDPRYLSLLEKATRGDLGNWIEWMKTSYNLLPSEERDALIKKHLEIGPSAQLNDFLCCDKFDIMDRVQEIRVPVLAICGDQDIMTPVKYTNYLAEKIPGAKKVLIEGATHLLFLIKPDAFNRSLGEFIKNF
jgi:pimeloyl-ACP methyl ester carboxylesterase